MKKIIISLLLVFSFLPIAIAEDSFDYSNYTLDSSPESFINAPSGEDLEKITDTKLRYCEETFLKAYMRRDFTNEENEKCREVFARRIEAEMNFKNKVFSERWI